MKTATMERKERDLESSFFPVKKVHDDNPLGYAIVDGDGEKISEVSDRYRLVTNREVVEPFIKRYGIEHLTEIRRCGKRFFYKFDIGKEVDFGDGDILRFTGYVANSYDKTHRFEFQRGIQRKVCSNGMFVFERGIACRQIHVGDIDIRELVKNALEYSGELNLNTWRKLKGVPVKVDRKLKLIEAFNAFDVEKEKSYCDGLNVKIRGQAKTNAERKGYDLENPENAWGLLNNINWGISKTIGQKNVPRLIKANRSAEEYLCKYFSIN